MNHVLRSWIVLGGMTALIIAGGYAWAPSTPPTSKVAERPRTASATLPELAAADQKAVPAASAGSSSVNQEHIWKRGEFEAGQQEDLGVIRELGIPLLEQMHQINLRPPYYNGSTLPITYRSTSVQMQPEHLTLLEASPLGHLIYYFYGNLRTVNYVLATGARAVHPASHQVLAEARLFERNPGSMAPMLVEEAHYDAAGAVVFRSRSTFTKSTFRFKSGELDTVGTKQHEFFLWWPSGF
jgi:hypothetical protein